MPPDIEITWTEQLSDEQRQQLQWLERRNCRVHVHAVHDGCDLGGDIMMEVHVAGHGLIRERNHDVRIAFDRVTRAATVLVSFGQA